MSDLIPVPKAAPLAPQTSRQFVTFSIGATLLGVDIILVREIQEHLDITTVDDVPSHVIGLLNLRGQIVTILDLGQRLHLGPVVRTADTRCIVLKTNAEIERGAARELTADTTSHETVGLLVEQVHNVVTVPAGRVELPSAYTSGLEGRFLDGIVKLDKRLLLTLRTSEVLALDDEDYAMHRHALNFT